MSAHWRNGQGMGRQKPADSLPHCTSEVSTNHSQSKHRRLDVPACTLTLYRKRHTYCHSALKCHYHDVLCLKSRTAWICKCHPPRSSPRRFSTESSSVRSRVSSCLARPMASRCAAYST